MGIATINKDYTSFSDLVEITDKALYCAKRNGRNRIEIFNNDIKC